MAKWVFAVATITPGTGTADGSSLTASTYMALQGGSSTQMIRIEEVYMGGQATSTSSPMIMLLGRDSTVVGTPTALSSPNSIGALHPSTAALGAPAVGAITGSTQAIRSNSTTLSKFSFTFNAQGGIVRANYGNTDQQFTILGNTASLGEASLSSFTGSTGSAPIGAHILFEPY